MSFISTQILYHPYYRQWIMVKKRPVDGIFGGTLFIYRVSWEDIYGHIAVNFEKPRSLKTAALKKLAVIYKTRSSEQLERKIQTVSA